MTLHTYLTRAILRLQAAAVCEAKLEAEIILMHVLGLDRTRLFLDDPLLTARQIDQLESMLARRLGHEPLAYIIGEKEFWSRPFMVCPDVLIPRPETEFLIELVLRRYNGKKGQLDILDLGVGSGVIAVTLALELANSRVSGVDSSWPALHIARQNAVRLGAEINLICADWLTALKPAHKFDLIVSNPPYVATTLQDKLQPELAFEPSQALYSGTHGLDSIKVLAAGLGQYLRPGAWFYMEIGEEQGDNVLDIFASLRDYDELDVHRDYAGRPRVLQARRKV